MWSIKDWVNALISWSFVQKMFEHPFSDLSKWIKQENNQVLKSIFTYTPLLCKSTMSKSLFAQWKHQKTCCSRKIRRMFYQLGVDSHLMLQWSHAPNDATCSIWSSFNDNNYLLLKLINKWSVEETNFEWHILSYL